MIARLLTLLMLFTSLASAAPKGTPNILFIFCDDLASQAISAYGEKRKLVETPAMDRIAKEGIRFDRCLVTNSICGPMRAVIQTGKYSHLNGFYNNSNSTFDSSQQTFPKLLQKAGYTNAIIGKWHLMTDPVGYDYWQVLPGQGAYYNPPMIDNGKPVKHEGYVTDVVTDLSIDWLNKRDKTKPFMLMMQHKAPHREWEPPIRHLGHDKDRVYDEPETLFDTFEGRSKAVSDHDMGIDRTFTERDAKLVTPGNLTPEQRKAWDAYYEPRNAKFREANLSGKDLVKWRYQRYMHDYTACVKAVDESVQKVLDYLDKEGLAENTLVILSSDQGFYLGEHGWFDKRWIFEESLSTPFLVRWPGVAKAGTTDKHIVSLLDLAQTFLDVAGQPQPADMQGRSLVPLFKGEAPADWRKSFYYHYYEFPVPHRVRPHYGVITDRYKLVHYYAPDVDDWDLLDREKDPLEVKNFYADPAYADTVKELKAELTKLQTDVKETLPPPRFTHGNKAFDNEPQPKAGDIPKKGKGKGKGKKKAE
ncbi:sulfatase family protein [Brevifollis gellanilyticus]|uniref:N-acetylglucosamine-6-sulfatase n=1 Tax=Brevifollis gellanilyticus TaxID=748831 RepID=A0A512ME80_9BACT|nr:sulfatase [Brevifollis gellanilyticus]GEP45002.1 N-acetylglucosamine-6-sulfatase [Brevifollis gellanilyticus]